MYFNFSGFPARGPARQPLAGRGSEPVGIANLKVLLVLGRPGPRIPTFLVLKCIHNKPCTQRSQSESRNPSPRETKMQRQKRAFAYLPKPGRSELELIKKNSGIDGMFTDPDFPVGPKALYADGQTPEGVPIFITNSHCFLHPNQS